MMETVKIDPSVAEEMARPNWFMLSFISRSGQEFWTKTSLGDRSTIEINVDKNRRKVDVEYATEYHPKIQPAFAALLQYAPGLADYQVTFDGPAKHTVRLLANGLTHDEDWIVLTWYHGTSSHYANIAIQDGLKPRATSGVEPSFVGGSKESQPHLVYLSADDGNDVRHAAREANRKTRNLGIESSPVILKIDARQLNPSKYTPDEDSGGITWEDSLHTMGTIGYKGIIPARAISVHMAIGDDNDWRLK